MRAGGRISRQLLGKTAEPLTADVLSYITSPLLDGCTVYDYETDSTGGVYDFTAAEKSPYDLFLGGPKALLRIETRRRTTTGR